MGAPRRWSLWQRFAWRRPEWWTLALSALAWLLLLTEAGIEPSSPGASDVHHHLGAEGAMNVDGPMYAWRHDLVR